MTRGAVPGAQVGVGDLYGDRRVGRSAAHGRLADGRRREREGGRSRYLAGHAVDREAVGPVGRDLDLEDRLGDRQVVGKRRAHRPVGRQHDDTRARLLEAELLLGEHHAVGLDAAQVGLAQLEAAFERGPGERHRHRVAGREVLGAADDLVNAAAGRPGVDRAQPELVGVGVALLGEHPAHAEERQVVGVVGRPDPVDALDLGAAHAEQLGELLDRTLPGDVLTQPAHRYSHQNCSRKRRSLSNRARASGTPCLSIAMRSTPMPKAKPCSSPAS